MTEDYQQKCSDLSINLNNMTRNLHLIEVDFFNTLNGLKTISGSKFIEHLIDAEDKKPEEENEEKKDTSEEDLMNEQYNSVNNIVQRGLDFITLRDQQKSQNKNNELDDTVSMNSKVMDNNLMKNNRGLKLPMIIGTQDFKENDFIGLVLDDEEEEEENFNNEIRNDQGVVIPKEGAQGEEKENIMNNNNMNNPEEFHNMVQQQMGKPIITQNMFENIDDDNKGENEFINPAMAAMNVENDVNIGGLGSLLRKTSLQPNIQNMNMINPNNINNMKRANTNLNDMRKTAIGGGGKFSLSNFLSKDMFGDDDDEEDSSGLFARPPSMIKGGLGMSMGIPNNNMQLNNVNNISNMQNQNLMDNNINNPAFNPQYQNDNTGLNTQYQNNNIVNNDMNFNQEKPYIEKNENIPLNQRMEMTPSPLLLSLKQNNINQNPQIQKDINNIENKEEEDKDDVNDDFLNRKKKLEKLFNQGQKPQMIKPMINYENNNMNNEMNQELNYNMNNNQMINNQYNNMQYNNDQNIIRMSQRELENKRKLENAKSKINSIFGDDDEEEDDLFSKKISINKAEKIEEKSQNLQERLNQLTSSYPSETSNINNNNLDNLFSNDNDKSDNKITNNLVQNNVNINNNNINSIKNPPKKKAFFFEDDDDDLKINQMNQEQKINQKLENNLNSSINNQNLNNINNFNINKNEPKIIIPKPIVQQQNVIQEPEKPKIETKKTPMFFFDDDSNTKNNNITTNQNNNDIIFNNDNLIKNSLNNNINNNLNNDNNNNNINKEIKDPSSLFIEIDAQKKDKIEEKEQKKVPNFFFEEEDNKKEEKEEKPSIEIKPENQQQNNKKNLFDILEVKKPEKKKISLFDIFETDKNEINDKKINENNISRNTIANTNTDNNININQREEPKKEESKKEEKKNIFEEKKGEEIKKRNTLFEPSLRKNSNENKISSRIESMFSEENKKEEKKNIISSQPKKLDFKSRISGFQDLLAGRMSVGGNVFTMPTGGIKTLKANEIVHDNIKQETEDENLKTEEKEISKENMNAILEDNKIQETSYEKQLEKKKENTVVIKKKKPKKIKFGDVNDNNLNENDQNNTENKENQNEEFISYVPPKFDLFSDENIEKKEIIEIKKEEEIKPKMNMLDFFKNEEKPKQNIANLFNDDININKNLENKEDENGPKIEKENNNLFKDINDNK